MAEIVGVGYLKRKRAEKKVRAEIRYKYYETKIKAPEISEIMPDFRWYNGCLGWCAKAVDSLADRLIFKGFKNDIFLLDSIFDANNRDVFFDSAILSALITSCSFVWISKDESGYPRLEVIDGREATGIIDPVTNLLTEGYAILEKDQKGSPTLEAYFTPEFTEFYRPSKPAQRIPNPAGIPLLVPVIYRPDAKRPFGHSRISRASMSLVEGAMRTVKRSEISAEFYSFPQKYVVGTSPDSEPLEKWKATISSMLEFTKDEDGDRPVLGQFQQQSMSPYSEQLRTFASLFAGENGLTLDDLGFVSENPSSAEAIKAAHETLRLTARKAQRTFGACFLNVGFVAACLRDNFSYERKMLASTKPEWEPIFEPDAAMLSGIGDGAIKINQAVPGYFNIDNLELLTGVVPSEIPVEEKKEPAPYEEPEEDEEEESEEELNE